MDTNEVDVSTEPAVIADGAVTENLENYADSSSRSRSRIHYWIIGVVGLVLLLCWMKRRKASE